eukprot:TRINITY_DN3052_c3_g1_i4.p1 TRINITY_DN3052_c3_g1~~TRINITY_DN3052_c3_g1_i4.p1  ORF type:complete len:54 (-),score=5.59 TRINITY_DN3052_c3_g1_i4:49-210(-)
MNFHISVEYTVNNWSSCETTIFIYKEKAIRENSFLQISATENEWLQLNFGHQV